MQMLNDILTFRDETTLGIIHNNYETDIKIYIIHGNDNRYFIKENLGQKACLPESILFR